jgi:allantoinase
MWDLLVRGAEVVAPAGVARGDVAIEEGRFVEIEPELAGAARETVDASGLYMFPGVVDTHVHFNEPGRTEWEGAATGSAALAAGGGTCFCDMPLNSSPPTLDGESFDLKRSALEAASYVDFGLWGGLTPANLDRMEELAERGVIGFKAFMCPSGIDDFLWADEATLERGMEIAARLGLPVGVHAEDPRITGELAQTSIAAGRTTMRDYLDSRPVEAEVAAIRLAVKLAEQTGCSLHVVHVSSAAGVEEVIRGRQDRGVDVSCETCPHYLTLSDEDAERIGAAAKCAPPLRPRADIEALWDDLKGESIEFVASDHSPSPGSMKTSSNLFEVWGGIAGVQSTLGLMLAEGHFRRGMTLEKIAAVTAHVPARRYRLPGKGGVEAGADADFVLVDPAGRRRLKTEELRYRHPISPYVGYEHAGTVLRTYVRGRAVFVEGTIIGSSEGRWIRPQP